jgi:predicted transcriptional regulator
MKKDLTKAEEQIMQVLWAIKKGFAKDILENLKEPKPAYNTVLTVVRILVKKGFVKFKTYGKSNEYYPTISKDQYSKQQLNKLKDNYFNKSAKELLSFFAKEQNLSLNEIEEILNQLKP